MIDNYSVKNFKIHKDEYPLNLKGLTLLTGVNNSGKSSITQSLRLLSKINKASLSYTKLPFDEIIELGSFTNTLNKNVNRSESITYTFGLNIKGFKFCDITLEFDSINNYDNVFIDMVDEAILKRIDVYFQKNNGDEIFDFEYLVNMNGSLPITYDLYKLDLDNEQRELIQKDVIVRGLYAQFIPLEVKEEYKDLMMISACLGNLNEGSISCVPAFRGFENSGLAQILEKNKDKIIFDGETKFSDAFTFWTHKILNSEFKVKIEGNIPKIVAIDNNIEFELSQIGFGNTQVLPIIVYILGAKKGDLVIIENPEVHLHPKWKTNLVELFYYATTRGVNILLETQSMEIVNRVRVRIKNDNKLKEQTSLYFFEKNGFKSNVQKIEIEKTGNLETWPDNFVDKITIDDSFELL